MTLPSTNRLAPGRPGPLGVSLTADGVNVALWAPEAEAVFFCLFNEQDGQQDEHRIALPYRQGGIWHAHIAGIGPGARYGIRAAGPHRPRDGLRFNVNKLLIDPYARALDGPLRYDPLMAGCVHGPDDDLLLDERDSAPVVPKAIILGPASGPDPTQNRPGHELSDLVIYEAHLKGLTAAHPEVPAELRGRYAGLGHPAVLEHLQSLGVNAVELLPVQAFIDDGFLVEQGLRNYWGYQPVAWFAPEPRYAQHDAAAELRALVHTLHEAGIEVILDVVYNHSGEGDARGPTLNLRGLNNTGYYRLLDNGRHYVNDTGTGNTLAVHNPMVLRLVMDSLRHWAEYFGVDGFRFDLAVAVGRNEQGFDARGAFFQAIRQDPVLAGLKLIAEPWDLGPGGYQLGHFPYPFAQWNDRYRDGVRRAWRGDGLEQAKLGARLLGSADLFDHSGLGPTAGINFLSAHDGFTLHDVVSYAHKHNEANLEDNRDGHSENFTDNLGVEGPTEQEEILTARSQRVRGMLTTLLVSQGVPMLLAGDEIGNSQQGNNNAYAQDNELGWIDWSAPDRELFSYAQRLIALRGRLPLLRQRNFLHGQTRGDGHPDVSWLRPDGTTPSPEDWLDPEFRSLAVVLRGVAEDPRGEALPGAVLIVLNLGAERDFYLPPTSADQPWQLEVDSARPEANSTVVDSYSAAAQSVVVLSNGCY
ncbi:glycogen debranching protein GlgX [Glutamicibacter sp. PS]|uniref:glycogen debranching protein GlgX n=1 Tax=Glutamicibacter sp. PS TaxID=3075634 RepID=UPI002840AC43|nr:glycogen debranching protein GlgX [Glutamicibacter sp. PS]MDR4532556.1 glycogen debranching protein GlgX [Glutamicibacter sp. PS]